MRFVVVNHGDIVLAMTSDDSKNVNFDVCRELTVFGYVRKFNESQQSCILEMLKKYGKYEIAVTCLLVGLQKNSLVPTKFEFQATPSFFFWSEIKCDIRRLLKKCKRGSMESRLIAPLEKMFRDSFYSNVDYGMLSMTQIRENSLGVLMKPKLK